LPPDSDTQTETDTEPIEPETKNFDTEMFPSDSESQDSQLDYQSETQSLDTQCTEPRRSTRSRRTPKTLEPYILS